MSDKKLLTLAPDAALPQAPAVQFFQKLKIAVTAGYWQPDQMLPSIEQLTDITGLSTEDINAAYQQLEREHWIEPFADSYRITPKIDQPVSSLSSLSDMLRQRGFSAGSVWLKRELDAPTLDEQCRLHLAEGVKIARLERLRTAGDITIGYESSVLPATFVPEPDKVGDSLYRFMEEHGLNISYANEEIGAFCCDSEMAEKCKLQAGQPMLKLTRTSYLGNGRALELTHSYFRSDYYRYVVELSN